MLVIYPLIILVTLVNDHGKLTCCCTNVVGSAAFDCIIGDTSYRFQHFPQSSGGHINVQLANAELDISVVGSAPFFGGQSRGLDHSIIYLANSDCDTMEGLAVRESSLPDFFLVLLPVY